MEKDWLRSLSRDHRPETSYIAGYWLEGSGVEQNLKPNASSTAHKLQRRFQLPMGACMCSPLFSAAGVRDMHLEPTRHQLGFGAVHSTLACRIGLYHFSWPRNHE